MSVPAKIRGPFPFSRQDLRADRLIDGVRHTVTDFARWRDANPGAVAARVDEYTARLTTLAGRSRPYPLGLLNPGGRRRAEREQLVREAVHFGVLNMAEVLPPATVDAVLAGAPGLAGLRGLISGLDERGGAAGVVRTLARRMPVLRDLPETRWLAGRLDRLHHILPDAVIRAGGMGKAVRAMAGVLVIGAFDTVHAGRAEAREHFARILPGAYAFGAAYAIVDDTLHDLPGYLSAREREHYGGLILRVLATGEPVDAADVPDHPLAEEPHDLHGLLIARYPFQRYRHLYHAAESMYRAQHRDATGDATGDATRGAAPGPVGGLAELYPDLVVKAGMSRVVANVLARREVDDGFYARAVNTVFVSQLRDDLIDCEEDRRAGRRTPFTVPAAHGDNPLYDLFAYNAYVAHEVFGGDPAAGDALASYDAARLAAHLSAEPARADDLARRYDATAEIARFLRAAAGLPRRAARRAEAVDQRLKDQVGRVLSRRDATAVDCRTFVSDRLPYLNEVVARYCPPPVAGELSEIVAYAMASPGKRLRPALSLMLAEALGVEPATVEPVLAAGELFHTASLIFDDLPAQDDASVRRGRPAAHVVFDEASAQLAALSMISTGFGLLARLDEHFPAHKVTEVIAYVGTVLGPDRLCRGQHLDLRMGDGSRARPASPDEILRMYDLKTATAIEAALVPLLMVLDRPRDEIDLLSRYAHHAGIVFQIRDDILDATSSTEVLGKDADNDVGKVNLVRALGLDEATRLMREHLAGAVECCDRLPFDARLLAGMARHFAARRR